MCDTCNCDYLKHSTFRFNLIDFQLNRDFPSQFCVFTVKSPSVTERSVTQGNVYKKSYNPSPFFVENEQIIKLFVLITKRVEIFWLSFSFLYLFFSLYFSFFFIYLFIYLFFFITEHTSIFNSTPFMITFVGLEM